MMRIIIVDIDVAFTSGFSERCKKAGVDCQVFTQITEALGELKKDPDSVDILLFSRELASDQDGLAMAEAIRKDPTIADVPYIIMSAKWAKPDFAKHQKSEFGANAYFGKKGPLTELCATIEAVTGLKFPAVQEAAAPSAPKSATPPKKADPVVQVQLQVASDVVNIAEDVPEDINMEEPINIFGDVLQAEEEQVEQPAEIAPEATAPPVEAVEAPKAGTEQIEVSLQMEAGTAVGKVESAPEAPPAKSDGGVEISVSGNEEFELETSQKPEGSSKVDIASEPQATVAPETPEAPATEQAPAESAQKTDSVMEIPIEPSATQSSIDIGIEMESGTAVASAESVQAQAPVAEAAPPAPSTEAQEPIVDPVFNIAGEPQTGSQKLTAETPAPVSEEEAAKDLPYLFAGPASAMNVTRSIMTTPQPVTPSTFEPAGVGVVSEDVETLKKYLTMREQDVSVLTAQLTYAKEELSKSEESIKRLNLLNEDLYHQIDDLKKRVENQEQELQHAGRSREGEIEQLRFEVKSKIDRIKFLEDRLTDSAQQYEKLKERVRLDIRKIRVREKELESKLEILKKDSETLIAARENKIIELKRKIDLLEFNYDTLQDKNELEKDNVRKANEKIDRIHKVLKLALGIIEAEGEQIETAAVKEELTKAANKLAS